LREQKKTIINLKSKFALFVNDYVWDFIVSIINDTKKKTVKEENRYSHFTVIVNIQNNKK